MTTLLLLLILLILSYFDIKNKSIPKSIVFVFILIGFIYMLKRSDSIFYVLISLVTGLTLIVISLLWEESLGLGDSLVIFALSMFVGIYSTLTILTIALTMALLFSIWLLVVHHLSKNDSFPFIPFIALGYLIVSTLSLMEVTIKI